MKFDVTVEVGTIIGSLLGGYTCRFEVVGNVAMRSCMGILSVGLCITSTGGLPT